MNYALDEFLTFDKADVVNLESAGAEIPCRWAYGYKEATALCAKPEHQKGAKAQLRTRWDLLDRHGALCHAKKGPSVEPAEKAVEGLMMRDALGMKCYEKVEREPAATC